MAQDLPPLTQALIRTRVAVPMEPPVQLPSLIPRDVLQDMEREARRASSDAVTESEARTSPFVTPDEVPIFMEASADVGLTVDVLLEVPLFRTMAREALEGLAQDAQELEIPAGELLFTEGEEASCFFIVQRGTFEILRQQGGRDVVLRHVGGGEALGLLGLVSARVRSASARAIDDCAVLRLAGAGLKKLLERDDALHDRMLRYYRGRLVEAFMSSRLFADLDAIGRARLIGQFAHKVLRKNDTLLSPGEVTNLLVVVTHGSLILEERSKAGNSRQLEVEQGQFVAVLSALNGLPGELRIVAADYATVSLVSHRSLNELLRDFPALRMLPVRLPGFARQVDRDTFCGSTNL
jgi:signal-transduction protein with cAMP-binding, CBS, and nucleotidyltransferase domain